MTEGPNLVTLDVRAKNRGSLLFRCFRWYSGWCKAEYYIITKEISRFSRSTLDSIRYTQELLDYNVGVFFQNNNINTLDTDSELPLTIRYEPGQSSDHRFPGASKMGNGGLSWQNPGKGDNPLCIGFFWR